MTRTLLACLMLFTALAPAWAADDLPDTLPRSWVVLEAFESSAFQGFGRGGVDGFGPRIRRWEGALRVAYFGDQLTTWNQMLGSFVSALSSVENLDITYLGGFSARGFLFALEGPPPTLTFITGDAAFLDQAMDIALVPEADQSGFRLSETPCMAHGLRTNTPEKAFVFIRNDADASARATCLGYWLVMATGLSIERQDLPTWFVEGGGGVSLTPVGRGAFGILYHPLMRSGTPMETARTLARDIVRRQGLSLP